MGTGWGIELYENSLQMDPIESFATARKARIRVAVPDWSSEIHSWKQARHHKVALVFQLTEVLMCQLNEVLVCQRHSGASDWMTGLQGKLHCEKTKAYEKAGTGGKIEKFYVIYYVPSYGLFPMHSSSWN